MLDCEKLEGVSPAVWLYDFDQTSIVSNFLIKTLSKPDMMR